MQHSKNRFQHHFFVYVVDLHNAEILLCEEMDELDADAPIPTFHQAVHDDDNGFLPALPLLVFLEPVQLLLEVKHHRLEKHHWVRVDYAVRGFA